MHPLIIGAAALGAAILLRKRRTNYQAPKGSSVLLAHYTRDLELISIAEGKIGDMHYNAYTTKVTGSLIVRVELPFATRTHLLNIPKLPGTPRVIIDSNSHMERVDLEGDYHRHFVLYCGRGEQTTVRYILDPKAMAFVIDFCGHFSWEIEGNELYLVQDAAKKAAQNPMFAQVGPFVDQIRPAIERPLTALERRAITPYGRDRRSSLKCPICGSDMPNIDSHFSCPNHHGTLLTGAQLAGLKNGELTIEHPDASHTIEHGVLICPACSQPMHQVPYNGSDIIIDSCMHCPYRWLDGAEIHAISDSRHI